MASNLNSEFNYRWQVMGVTPWEKLKQLQNFLVGRKQAQAGERSSEMRLRAKQMHLEHLKTSNALPHEILVMEADMIDIEAAMENQRHAFELNRAEIAILEKLIAETYAICEPTRIPGYTDDMMFEANANLDFTVTVGREIQAEIIANGRPSPAKLLNAMSNPETLESLINIGLIPSGTKLLQSADVQLYLSQQPETPTLDYTHKVLGGIC
jgi:hypothetical protein